MLIMRCSPIPVPVLAPVGDRVEFVQTMANYALEELSLIHVLHPMGEDADVPSYLPGISALVQLLAMLPSVFEAAPWALKSTVEKGLIFLRKDLLQQTVSSRLPLINASLKAHGPEFDWPANFEDWGDRLNSIHASAWPLIPGNFVVPYHDFLMIDVAGASQALLHRLEVSRSPLLGNLRASQFELQCQRLIDKTLWAPSPSLAGLRGRPLRAGGVDLTDVDAIGQKGDELLVVSCKSLVYDADYDRGEYRVVRNAKTTVDEAVTHWASTTATLQAQPKGENFDFSMFKRVIGVVCTPFVAYTDAPTSLEYVAPGLRACSSIFELAEWLGLEIEAEG